VKCEYLVQIWDVDSGHVKTCPIKSRPFTELLYYLHHHSTKKRMSTAVNGDVTSYETHYFDLGDFLSRVAFMYELFLLFL
jgi:hypothetical protein